MSAASMPPLLQSKDYAAPSVFRPENMLREARRQKHLLRARVPDVCVLDPDGDILRQIRADGRAQPDSAWACYHTDLYTAEHKGEAFGVVGSAVGASFAVLVAEQLFASGCRFLISITSAGQIISVGPTPYFVLIDRAMRDEGTSYHYLPPALFADADPSLVSRTMMALSDSPLNIKRGATWSTDAPFRETTAAIDHARSNGILAVEMEAAALYAFAQALIKPIMCFAHVTNQMGQSLGEFEKGEANGANDALDIIATTARAWRSSR
jgi:uridine phosphorylase